MIDGIKLGGYLPSPCPNGPGFHANPWYWSGTGVTAITFECGLPPETKIEPCPNCIYGG